MINTIGIGIIHDVCYTVPQCVFHSDLAQCNYDNDIVSMYLAYIVQWQSTFLS